MPKPVKKAPTKRTTRKPSSDPNTRAGQMMAEHMGKLGQGKWADKPAPVPEPTEPFPSALSEYMSAIGKKGGKVSGAKRMEMPEKQRKAIAKKAAQARWGKK